MAGLCKVSFPRGDGRERDRARAGSDHRNKLDHLTIHSGGTKPLSGSNQRGALSWAQPRPRQPSQPRDVALLDKPTLCDILVI
jgi:hypothetical protein